MLRMTQIRLNMDEPISVIPEKIRKKLNMKKLDISEWKIVKESIDARKKPDIKFTYTVDFTVKNEDDFLEKKKNVRGLGLSKAPDMSYEIPRVHELKKKQNALEKGYEEERRSSRPVVAGFGPCGMFAALILAEAGLKPIVIERGRNVRQRTEDVERFWSEGKLDPISNVQFGEGGAGTFSDGKLTTGIKDKRMTKVREEFIEAGADPDIAYRHMPHIGTDVLRTVVENIRKKIISLGGEVMFETKLTDLNIIREDGENAGNLQKSARNDEKLEKSVECDEKLQKPESGREILRKNARSEENLQKSAEGDNISSKSSKIDGITVTHDGQDEILNCKYVALCPGNSARDTFRMLDRLGIKMEAKPFSVGVRIEHPQSLIDLSQYGFEHSEQEGRLGAAAYKLSYHTQDGRGVYTFCMCPGGVVVGAASEENTVVTNGMSYRARDGKNANSALLVDVNPEDLPGDRNDVLAGIRFQEEIERKAYIEGGGDYFAPVQTVGEFLREAVSAEDRWLVEPTYRPGDESVWQGGSAAEADGKKAGCEAASADGRWLVEPTYRPGDESVWQGGSAAEADGKKAGCEAASADGRWLVEPTYRPGDESVWQGGSAAEADGKKAGCEAASADGRWLVEPTYRPGDESVWQGGSAAEADGKKAGGEAVNADGRWLVEPTYRPGVESVWQGGSAAEADGKKAGGEAVNADGRWLVEPTYRPGVRAGRLGSCLPAFVIDALREAIPDMARRLKGFDMTNAVMTCAETRSSCPVRIVRDGVSLESVTVSGLYPGGEGAGYAGGIMSAGVDGIRIAEKIIEKIIEE